MDKKKNILIMGLGLHGGGVGAVHYFVRNGASVTITDLKTEDQLRQSIQKLPKTRDIRFIFGRHDYRDFEEADIVIKNPAVPNDSPYLEHARKHGVRIDSDVGVFFDAIRSVTPNIIGVTGTKGKSTTASLIHAMFSRRYPGTLIGGNITVSVFDLLEKVQANAYVILELSSFQLGGASSKRYSPRIGLLTNFMEDHLNYYKSMEDYFLDKSFIYRFQKRDDLLVLNRDDRSFSLVERPEDVRLVSFGLGKDFSGDGIYTGGGKIYFTTGGKAEYIMDIAAIGLPGIHNLYNVLAASSVAYSEGIQPEDIEGAARSFHGLSHRLEYVGCRDNIRFYNDSAATTPHAAVQGILSLEAPLTLIAGGTDKGLDPKELIQTIESRVDNLVLLEGDGTRRLIGGGLKREHTVFGKLREAVYHAFSLSKPYGTVLFSPGYASFGMFRNEFHRGDEFKRVVSEILEQGAGH